MIKEISKKAIIVPLFFLTLTWLGFVLQSKGFFPNCEGALMPLMPEGLKGIFISPFLHGGFEHIISNSIPIVVLLFLLFQFYPEIAYKVFLGGWIFTGLLVWLLPPMLFHNTFTCIIGASGIVYMLAFFLFFSGVIRWKNLQFLTISLIVALYYGNIIWGVFPEEFFFKVEQPGHISWESHLSGALVGIIFAYIFKNKGKKRKKYIWEFPNYYSEESDELWQEYKRRPPEDFMQSSHKEKDTPWGYLEELRRKK